MPSSRCYRSYRYYGSVWLTKHPLTGGSAWEDQYKRAQVAFEIITVLALLAVLVWSITVRKGTRSARALFPLFLASVSIAIISFAWSFINRILNEECVAVLGLYLIFNIIFTFLRLLADVLLLSAIVTLLVSCIASAGSAKPRMTSRLSAVLYGVCGLLGVFWLLITVLSLAYYIQAVMDKGTGRLFEAVTRVKFVFDLLYLFIVTGILLWGVSLMISSKGGNNAQQKKPITMIVLIGILLFIRQMWITVLDGLYNLGTEDADFRVESDRLAFANSMFYYVCTILAYAALVAAMFGLQTGSSSENGENGQAGHQAGHISSLVAPVPSWNRESLRDDSQDPIYNGPEMVRSV